MAVLGSGVLMLSATAGAFQKDMSKARASVDGYEKSVKAVPEISEKINSGLSRIASSGNVFGQLAGDATLMEKSLLGANAGVAALTVGMQLATKVSSGLKAALLGTGIGAIVVGLGWIVSSLSKAREDSQKEREEWQKWLDRIERTSTRVAAAPLPAVGAWDLVSLDEVRRRRFEEGVRARSAAARETIMRPAAELGIEADRAATGIEDIASAAGRSGHALTIFRLETRAATLALDPLIASSDTYRRILADLDRARAGALAIDLRTETERLRTPLELVNAELARMSELLSRSGNFELFRLGVMNLIGAPEVDAITGRVETIITAFRVLARARDEATRPRPAPRMIPGAPGGPMVPEILPPITTVMGALEAVSGVIARLSGPLDVARTVDALATVAGDRPGALSAFGARMDAIDVSARAAAEAVFRGGGAPVDFRRFDRGRARAFLDVERSLGNFERAAPQALLEGSVEAVSAINAARRNAVETDPMRRVERVLERLERIEEAERRELEGIGAVLSRGIRRV